MIMTTVLPVLHVLPWPSPWTGDWLAYLSTIVSTFAQPTNHSRDDDVPLLLLWLLRRTRSFYDTLHLILLGLSYSCVCRRRLPISQKRIQLFAMAKEDDEEEDDNNNNIMNSNRGAIATKRKTNCRAFVFPSPFHVGCMSSWASVFRIELDGREENCEWLSLCTAVCGSLAQARMYGWSM